jgi:glycogen phosphorylase
MSEARAIGATADHRLAPDTTVLDDLNRLALDLRWSWNHAADEVWRRLDPALWELTHNPRGLLQAVGEERIAHACSDPAFRRTVSDLLKQRDAAAENPAWFQITYPHASLNGVAYFSMEFMLSEALPIYSGGLGNVAGDQLKAASDLRVPVIGVGLLYQVGYFRQLIDARGEQQAVFPHNDPGQLPIEPLRDESGEWLRLRLDLPGSWIWVRAWQVRVGNAKLYLLDSNDIANYPPYRAITGQLYVGDPKLRLLQELVLGIGGWRLLEQVGEAPEVCHLNEGHAALAVLERARSFMRASGEGFDVALAVTRAGNIFTTHTAVAAGFDRFAPELMDSLLRQYAQDELGISMRDLLALGRRNPNDTGEPFNMAYLAIHGSGAVNGVSRLHGEVSRRLFTPLFERWPVEDVPIGHVTNGVHMPSWDSADSDELWTEVSGKERWRGDVETLEHEIRQAPDSRLWQFRNAARSALVDHVRQRRARELAFSGASADLIARTRQLFDPHILTIGFARRFATYKRPNLLLHDAARLVRLLGDAERPIQLVLAGKAHPADGPGQALIHQWVEFIRTLTGSASGRVVFLADYDMLLTERLVQGVDVWLNTPRRPWEASGTSGMKALVNGGLNLSELDGWWAEAYAPECGWALGNGRSDADEKQSDAADAVALFDLLEQEVVPEFYMRDANGIPTAWVARMRESMARLTPTFSTNRSVREYLERYYLPASKAFRDRAADHCAAGKRIVDWQRALEQHWPALRFGNVSVRTENGLHTFDVELFCEGIEPSAIRVELFAESSAGAARDIREMTLQPTTAPGGSWFRTSVPATRPAADYTPRVVPWHDGTSVPLEARQILWQR